MDKTMMWILYGVLIVILGVVGYYVGKSYNNIGSTMGAGIGIAAGVVISGVIWYTQSNDDGIMAF
jgi:Ni,Fe-hydrogenase I cytochrome b subunit